MFKCKVKAGPVLLGLGVILGYAASGLPGLSRPAGATGFVGEANAAEPRAAAAPAADSGADRPSDRAALKAVVQSFAKAFESRDAKALVAHWTAEGEYQNDNGIRIQGREKLEKSFAR